MLHAAVADAAPGEVLVVQCHDPSYGVWGEVLMTGAMARGVVALVIDGGVRDLEATREAGFPVFSRSVAIRGAGKSRRGLLRQPISCGGILVWPSDIVVADDSGVIAIAADQVEAVLERAGARRDKEARMLESLRAGQTTADLLGLRGALARPTA
jgi:4-hydroxy-4-methyl-2-oxoglutarate aldolase